MKIRSWTLNDSEYTRQLNNAKDLMLDQLFKEKILSEDQVNTYKEDYAIILINKDTFVNFCKSIFKSKDEEENYSYFKVIKKA